MSGSRVGRARQFDATACSNLSSTIAIAGFPILSPGMPTKGEFRINYNNLSSLHRNGVKRCKCKTAQFCAFQTCLLLHPEPTLLHNQKNGVRKMPVTKRGKSWRATLCVNRIRDSATFDTRAEAEAWESKRRAELSGGTKAPSGKAFGDLLDRYVEEVSITKRGERWERIRVEAIKREPLARVRLADLDSTHIVAWRNKRLREVSGPSVIREMTLISHACEIARREWKWLTTNPCRDVGRPKAGKHRTRRITADEIEQVCLALGFNGHQAATAQQRTAVAFLFAIETAMRSGEICALRKQDIAGSVAHLPMTKNGSSRDVPLSPRALELLALLPPADPLFGLSDKVRDATFRLAISRTTIKDLRFHDTRREATSRLSKIFDVLELARITGHKDIKMLLVYYQTSAEDLAKRMA